MNSYPRFSSVIIQRVDQLLFGIGKDGRRHLPWKGYLMYMFLEEEVMGK